MPRPRTQNLPLNVALKKAVAHHQAGRLKEAEQLYRAILKVVPDDPDVNRNMEILTRRAEGLTEADATKLTALFNSGCYGEMECHALILLEQHPKSGVVWKVLGVSLLMQGKDALSALHMATQLLPDDPEAHFNFGVALQGISRLDDAMMSYRRAIAIKPTYAEAHNNLGNVLRDLQRFAEAVGSFRNALQANSNYAEAYSNLSSALREEGKLHEAVESCRQALKINPEYAKAQYNLGVALYDLDHLEDAITSYRRALDNKPDYAEVLCSLGIALLYLDDLNNAELVFQQAWSIDQENVGLEAAVYSAIVFYLNGNYAECRNILNLSESILRKTGLFYRSLRAYWSYLDKLLHWHQKYSHDGTLPQKLKTLYVIGESHVLSLHGLMIRHRQLSMQCVAELIIGCKQWHLGNDKENKYKRKFEAITARIPANSTILLCIGEIDCRLDEGIIQAWKKSPEKTTIEIVRATIESYIKYVTAIVARFGHKVILSGVPCPNIHLNEIPKSESVQFVKVVRDFNLTLKSRALEAGMEFLDVYALTDRGDGIASGADHIDANHLTPLAMSVAFDNYCLRQ